MSEQLNQFYSVEDQDSQAINGEASLSNPYQPELQQQFSDPELDLLSVLSSSLQRQIGIKMESPNVDATEQDDSPENEYDDNDDFDEEESYENDYQDEDERIEFRNSYKRINQVPLTPEIY